MMPRLKLMSRGGNVVDTSSGAQGDHETGFADFWKFENGTKSWKFHHVSPHKRLFHPSKGGNGGPSSHDLDPLRETRGKYVDDQILVDDSDWAVKGSHKPKLKHWGWLFPFLPSWPFPREEIFC